MTATSTAIDSTLLGYRNNDKPVLAARNILEEGAANFPKCASSGVFASADESDSDYPIVNIYDRRRGTQWRHDTNQQTVYVLMDSTSHTEANGIIIEGHDGVLSGADIRVRCSDTLSGGAIDPAAGDTFTPIDTTGGAQRFVSLWDNTYSARYWEIQFDDTSSHIYRARQIWLLTQVFLPHKSSVPYDEDEKISDFVQTQARSGAITRVGFFAELARRDWSCWVNNTDSIDLLKDAWVDSDGWILPIWHIEDPNSAAGTSAVFGYLEEAGLALPSQLEQDRIWDNAIREDGPHID
jgi:hypothetical protein